MSTASEIVFDQNDDFWEKHATSITGNELRQRMYQRIDAWKQTSFLPNFLTKQPQ